MKFDSRIRAIVSGGVSGLGGAVAEKVIAAGGKVAMLDIADEKGAAAAQRLGPNALYIRCNVADDAEVTAAVAQAVRAFDGLNLSVACAGILGAGRVLGREGPMPSSHFEKVIAVNVVGTFNLCKAAAAAMQSNAANEDGERGVLVNTASVAAFEGQIGQAAYSASKGAVVGMMLPLAREFARLGIRVMTIAPGIFWTPMMEGMPEDVQKSLGAQVPFPSRLGRPHEYADLVASIVENTMLNGETIRLDGAIRMQPK
jgi:NAD(P)-dependent dehydrogenase (short-subunit alcohol dehydrogenase family)